MLFETGACERVSLCDSLDEFIEHAKRDLRLRESNGNQLVEAVRRLIECNIQEVPTLEDIAQLLCVSSRTLSRKLERSDFTYRSLSESIRKDYAIELLLNSRKTISDIGRDMGFSDPSNFTKAFRNWTGLSPREYRLVNKSKAPQSYRPH